MRIKCVPGIYELLIDATYVIAFPSGTFLSDVNENITTAALINERCNFQLAFEGPYRYCD